MMDEIDVDEFEQGIESPFWRSVREQLATIRQRDMAECCSEGVGERRADGLRGRIELLNLILGAGERQSLPDLMLAEMQKEAK